MSSVVRIQRKNGQIVNGYRVVLEPEEAMSPKDVVYIGRACYRGGWGLAQSKWYNPFTVSKYGTEEAIRRYGEYLRSSPLMNSLEELREKTLGCWCKPESCHGDVIVKLLSEKGL